MNIYKTLSSLRQVVNLIEQYTLKTTAAYR